MPTVITRDVPGAGTIGFPNENTPSRVCLAMFRQRLPEIRRLWTTRPENPQYSRWHRRCGAA